MTNRNPFVKKDPFRKYSPAQVRISEPTCDETGQLSAVIEVDRAEHEVFDGSTCGQGLVVLVNGFDADSVVERAGSPTFASGVYTHTYDMDHYLGCGMSYEIRAKFYYVIHGSSAEETKRGDCPACE